MTRRPVRAIGGEMRTIHYLRVSTARQGRSGLGLEAQRAAVAGFCASRGCDMLAEYVEVESGRKSDRAELAKALHHAKMTGATMIIAKWDRLGRDLAFLTALEASGAKFVAADNPEANQLTIHILCAVAQAEAVAISERTKAALEAARIKAKANGQGYKADGTPWRNGDKLGNPLGAAAFGDMVEIGQRRAAQATKDNAQAFAEQIRPIIDDIRSNGLTSMAAIAAELNRRQIMTARSGSWSTSAVHRIIQRTETTD